ncbi:AlkZ family DNA glycosylase [Pseudonocardia sp. C8]|uniref:winged helix DNA-binding domain-containing protein n=1 Tax=Pseudonocardia sp. C8 TaxID=2762759 RepID=UPI0016428E1C|nr:AlkZ family DNA glycosylase [Pseudonocardia sp. C8]
MTHHVSDAERRARLVTRHRLAPHTRTDDVVAIADDLVALHSTDPVTVYLSAAARMVTPALEPVDAALYTDRTLLRHHAMRRTLWVFGRRHAALAHHAATAGVAAVQRRNLMAQLREAGVTDPEAWYAEAAGRVLDVLAERGPAPAREIGAALPDLAALGVPIQGTLQAGHTRVLLLLGFEGRVLRARPTGTWINGQYRWAAAEAWVPGGIGPVPGPAGGGTVGGDAASGGAGVGGAGGAGGTGAADGSARVAAAGLARAYLRSFGPVTRDDLKWWAGWTVATARTALADAGAVEVSLDGGGTGFLLPDDLDPVPDPGPSVALLPGLDPTTMGWKARDWYLAPEHRALLFDRNGNGGPAIWVDGRIAGSWVQRRDGEIVTRLFDDVGGAARAGVDAAAARIRELLGDVRFTVRYPAPVQGELLAERAPPTTVSSGRAPGPGR